MTRHELTRRGLLLAATFAAALPARGAMARRVAAVDWAMLESALALGVTPVAGTELALYRRMVVEPAVPEVTTDLGLRGAINYELLRLTAPDLILSSPFYAGYEGNLSRIAPIFSRTAFAPGSPALPTAHTLMADLGVELGIAERATGYARETETFFDQLKSRLPVGMTNRPVYIISLGDERYLRAFGFDSIFGATLERLGFTNAWTAKTSYGAIASNSLEKLAEVREARIVIMAPLPPEAKRLLPQSMLWNAIPAVAERRVHTLASCSAFGGLPTARRFGRLLVEALAGAPA